MKLFVACIDCFGVFLFPKPFLTGVKLMGLVIHGSKDTLEKITTRNHEAPSCPGSLHSKGLCNNLQNELTEEAMEVQ